MVYRFFSFLFNLSLFLYINSQAYAQTVSKYWTEFDSNYGAVKLVKGNPPERPEHGQSLEMLTERSHPKNDPSNRNGFHYELLKPIPQSKIILKGLKEGVFLNSLDDEDSSSSRIVKNPKFFEKMNRFNGKDLNIENTSTFVNSDYEYFGISDRKFGFCWGVSTLNRFFTYLSYYDVSKEIQKTNDGKINLNFYQKIILDITSGKARLIPGFRNFRSFSSQPEIEMLLKLRAIDLWKERSVNFESVKMFYGVNGYVEDKNFQYFIHRIQNRIRAGHLSKILFTSRNSHKVLGGNIDIHTVLVERIEKADENTIKLFVWDPNFYGEDIREEQQFLEIKKVKPGNYQIYYKPWMDPLPNGTRDVESGRVNQVFFSPEEEEEMKMISKALDQKIE